MMPFYHYRNSQFDDNTISWPFYLHHGDSCTCMMTSSNGNIFRVSGHLCGEFTGPRWIPRTKASDAELLMFSLICVWINNWVNNREAGDLRRYRGHYDVIVMGKSSCLRPVNWFLDICYFYPRPVLAFGYCRCLRLCVRVCVYQSRACPHDNSPLAPSS